ncbi:hypothetical protein J5226_08775 [Lysobacter sp. K5869]|uniref:hypothetical protein n=1 Tax=Lysobacter sp. K5869 TaxID=2820808 RepID=UPI001C062931|nr:hypothetical protein [Lysobacter sp. K5869]QWP78466.1 hypothetical protein J5226_08775 [Lysobacter sp. K5869]
MPIEPNPDLNAAISNFEKQPGVTAQQVAQLRHALGSDPGMLRDLNQEATAGQLRGFAVQAAGTTPPSLVGSYNLSSGVITLPAASFQATGNTSSADLRAVVQVQEMSVRFGNSRFQDPGNAAATLPVTQDMIDNLQGTINGSPVLAREVKKAATTADPGDSQTPHRNHLENFGFVSGIAAGGTYDGEGKTMRLPAARLQSPTYDAVDMTFVLGHEIEHGFNHPTSRAANQALFDGARAVAAQPGATHDYTATIGTYLEASRKDEAEAEIAGWNAALSRLQQANPAANQTDMLNTGNSRMQDFVHRDPATNTVVALPAPAGKQPLQFNPDGSLNSTPDNVAAMGRQYFDRPPNPAPAADRPLGIGERGSSDYSNYYGAHAVEAAIGAERDHALAHPGVAHRMTLNMSSLRLSEDLLEREGINIQRNPGTPQPYYDSGHTPPAAHHFDHTQNGANDHTHVPIAGAPPAPSALERLSPNDRAMFERLREQAPANLSEDTLGRALHAAKAAGIERPDQIASARVSGERLWVEGTTPGFHAAVNVAGNGPGLRELAQAQQPAQQETQQQAQQQEQARTAATRAH